LLLWFAEGKTQSYSRYIIQFTNKAFTTYSFSNPALYLSQAAIDRRTRYNIALDSTDLPVTPRYLDSIQAAGAVTILNVSRWLNQVSIQTTDAAALAKIKSFSFVAQAAPIAARLSGTGSSGVQSLKSKARAAHKKKFFQPMADYYSYGASFPQIHLHNGEFLHNLGLRGQTMSIGLLDGGFYHYTTLNAFDSVRLNNQVADVYDYVAKDGSVLEDDVHGMECFSIIAANLPGQFVGAAPKAGFLLYRTENSASEFPIEEHNWVCAAERVDSAGGDVLSSSLGYSDGMTDTLFNHSYAQLNGRTTIAARGAVLAARKGILVVNAAGNQGNETFHYLSTPADADSILAVGAVDTSKQAASFSSYGPTADGRVKPDVASVGVKTVFQTPSNTVGVGNGTSFACPNMAGLAACLWQGFREFNNIKIIEALRQAGSKATAPDNRVGYGIPDVKKAVLRLLQDFSTATINASGSCRHAVNWTSKDVNSMLYEIERRGAGETAYKKIGTVQGTGTSFATHQYQFTDSILNLSPGKVTYRIRQVIDTTAATLTAGYIDSVDIVYNSTCNVTATDPVPTLDALVQLRPNPASDKVSVLLSTVSPITKLVIRVFDNKGSLVSQLQTAKAGGQTTVAVPIQTLAKGQYYLSIFNGEKQLATATFMKL